MLKVAVFGNRNITDEKVVTSKFLELFKQYSYFPNVVYLHGGASGPQKIISDYLNLDQNCDDGSVEQVLFKPWHMVWSKLDFTPIFFYLRNKQIVENADKVIIFSNSEKDSEVYRVIDLCERWNKDFVVIEV